MVAVCDSRHMLAGSRAVLRTGICKRELPCRRYRFVAGSYKVANRRSIRLGLIGNTFFIAPRVAMSLFSTEQAPESGLGSFRRAVWSGLGVFLPPLLTLAIVLWVANSVRYYLLVPVENLAAWLIVESTADVRQPVSLPGAGPPRRHFDGLPFRRTSDDQYVPEPVFHTVVRRFGHQRTEEMTAREIYFEYVKIRYLNPWLVVPSFLLVLVVLLWFLGRFMAAGLGRFFWETLERIIARVPLVRNVYSSVKQVTDFLLKQREIRYTRVVAVQYPRQGTWSLGFVTGDGLRDVEQATGEPVLALLVPTSPMPLTGYTVVVPASEVVDLNMTVDQALEFLVSCGVVVPPEQLPQLVHGRSATRSAPGGPLSPTVSSFPDRMPPQPPEGKGKQQQRD